MSSDRIDVRHVAKLARLALDDAEVAQYGEQLGFFRVPKIIAAAE
jgi:Asp-tRNA(Asn)/Glu-tRNA(Gln) amidotransferase C subunit